MKLSFSDETVLLYTSEGGTASGKKGTTVFGRDSMLIYTPEQLSRILLRCDPGIMVEKREKDGNLPT